MALGCGLTSVRGNRGKNYENEPLVPQKHTKKKKKKKILKLSRDLQLGSQR
jgi:accessory gene regulator protein AgrB